MRDVCKMRIYAKCLVYDFLPYVHILLDIQCLHIRKKKEEEKFLNNVYNEKKKKRKKNENRYAKRIYVYVHIRFRRRSRKNKKYWSIKGYGLFMFSPCSSSPEPTSFPL